MNEIDGCEFKEYLRGSGRGKWEWRGANRSSDRFRDLKLSFFRDCGSTATSDSIVAPDMEEGKWPEYYRALLF